MKNLKALIKAMTAFLDLRRFVVAKSAREIKTLQPVVQHLAERIIKEMFNKGYAVMVFQGYRSFGEQNYLYGQGRSRDGAIITNAKGGQSLHNYGVALDIVFLKNGNPSWSNSHPWKTLGKVGKDLGFIWGGDWTGFVDRPHFQLTYGYSLTDFQKGNIDYSKYKI